MTVFKNIFYILCTTKHDDFTRVFRLFTTVNVWQTSFVEPIVGNIFDRQNVQINAEGTRDRKKAWENSNTVCLSLSLSLSLLSTPVDSCYALRRTVIGSKSVLDRFLRIWWEFLFAPLNSHTCTIIAIMVRRQAREL